MSEEFSITLREVLGDLRKPLVRWLALGVLGLTVAVLIVVVVVDQRIDEHELLSIAVGMLVLSLVALSATCVLGDMVRVMSLRLTGGGFADLERRKMARRLSLRAMLVSVLFLVLIFGGLPLVTAVSTSTTGG